MSKTRVFLCVISIFFIFHGFDAQAQEAKARWEMMNLIRKEKLDIILPQAMRENNIDMWILVNRYGKRDPLAKELGGGYASDKWYQGNFLAYIVFTDRGGDRIERAALGTYGDPTIYDVFGATGDLKKFVEERDPKRVAVNMSEYLGSADGLSYTCYMALVNALGEKYAARLVSSEMLVSDFRSRKVASEIAVFAKSIELTGRLLDRALSNEVITPGVTTLGDVAWWVADQLLARGYTPSYDSLPRILYPKMHTTKDGRQIVRAPTGPRDRVIQRGDLVGWDTGIHILGSYGTDIERYAYVLREGEIDLPKTIKDTFAHGLKVRKLIQDNVKPGRTGLETLNILYRKVKELGYQICYVEDQVSDNSNIEINIGWHSVGEAYYHGSGPAVWTDKDQIFCSKLVLKPTHLQAFEFFVYYPVPEWGGKKMLFDFEENVIITENGVEFFIPQIEKIKLIR
jgi:methionine aminopeptidase